MDLKVVWTNNASSQLEEVFDYFKTVANISVARKLVKEIVHKTKILSTNPRIGQKESLLSERKREYRYLVEGNYKIIYWVESTIIFIAAVFDTRQNPVKMKEAVQPKF